MVIVIPDRNIIPHLTFFGACAWNSGAHSKKILQIQCCTIGVQRVSNVHHVKILHLFAKILQNLPKTRPQKHSGNFTQPYGLWDARGFVQYHHMVRILFDFVLGTGVPIARIYSPIIHKSNAQLYT
jgi:hypothetical protein